MKRWSVLPAMCILFLAFLEGCSRVDPDEIEIVLNKFPAIHRAVVVEQEEKSGERRLVAYAITEAGRAPTAEEIQSFLKQKAPDLVMPSAFVIVDSFPPERGSKTNLPAPPAPERASPAPSDPLELQLVKLWESLLDARPIGITDDFFELGGDGSTARGLFLEIEKMTGRELPARTIFEAPTVEQLADILENEEWAPRWQSLAPIQPDGDNRPLFFVHPMGGDVFGYTDLARRLGRDQPFYGLQAVGLDGKLPPLDRVEDMAAHYLEEAKSVCPEGPYRLGGRCAIGGLIALEMARQLMAQGQEVELLAMIDVRIAPRLNLSAKELERRISSAHSSQNKKDRLFGKIFSASEDERARRLKEVKAANDRARDNYLPEVFPGRISFFLSEKHWKTKPSRFFPDSPAGWQNLARDGVELYVGAGEHSTMLEEPFVEAVAETLKARLDGAQRDEHEPS